MGINMKQAFDDHFFKQLVEANGIQFTPDGQELLLLGMFIVRYTTSIGKKYLLVLCVTASLIEI